MSTMDRLPPIRPGHALYGCRSPMKSGDLMYGVPMVSQVRSQALLHWINGQDGFGRDLLPAWDVTALKVTKAGNVVVWEKQTEGQGRMGLSARVLVEEDCKWVMQVWPSETPQAEEWAPFSSVTLDKKLFLTPGLHAFNLGTVLQHCFRTFFGKSIKVELLGPLRSGENGLRILLWDVREGKWLDRERVTVHVAPSA